MGARISSVNCRQEGTGSGPPSPTLTKKRRDGLSQPKEHTPDMIVRGTESEWFIRHRTREMTEKEARLAIYGSFADNKNCTHRPRTKKGAAARSGGGGGGGSSDGDEKGGAADAFVYRMEAGHRKHASDLELRRGQAAYAAVVDKRSCPKCGATQSYDEVVEKRKKCPECNVEYRRKRAWGTIKAAFLRRLEEDEAERQRRAAAAAAELAAAAAAAATAQPKRSAAPAWGTRDEAGGPEEFLRRLEEDLQQRSEWKEAVQSEPPPGCTFRPELYDGGDTALGQNWDGASFLERVEDDLRRRREAKERYAAEAAERAAEFGWATMRAADFGSATMREQDLSGRSRWSAGDAGFSRLTSTF